MISILFVLRQNQRLMDIGIEAIDLSHLKFELSHP
jgi:hypothetical protein